MLWPIFSINKIERIKWLKKFRRGRNKNWIRQFHSFIILSMYILNDVFRKHCRCEKDIWRQCVPIDWNKLILLVYWHSPFEILYQKKKLNQNITYFFHTYFFWRVLVLYSLLFFLLIVKAKKKNKTQIIQFWAYVRIFIC